MQWPHPLYILPLLVTAIISAALALYAWRRSSVSSARPFALHMLALTEWSLGYAFELACPDLASKVFWVKVEYLGIVILPVTWLIFALQYTGQRKWTTGRTLILLMIVPLITLLMVWTNEVHGLFYSNVRLDTHHPLPMLDTTYGPWFWIHTGYSYLLLLTGTLLFLWTLIRSPHLYRRQAGTVLVAVVTPWVGNALYLSGLTPFPHLDLTPFAFTLSGLALGWGLLYFRLLDIMPMARDAVIKGMNDGVIMLDARNRIVDLNPAAQQIINRSAAEAIGQPAARMFSARPDLVERYSDVREAREEIVLGEGEAQRIYDLRISPLQDQRSRLTGRLIILRDISGRKRAEEALRKAHDELERRVRERTAELTQANTLLEQEITERKQAEMALAAERERLAVTLRSIADGVMAVDAEGRIVLTNPKAREYLALLADVAVGDVLSHLGNQPLGKLLQPPPEGETCHVIVLEGPPSLVFEVAAQPMGTGPQANGWVLVLRNVTQEREAQQRIQQQERLAAVGQLAAGVAHDFNNILTAIIGFAQLLQMRADIPESAKGELDLIMGQGQRAARLIRQILDFSRKSISQRRPLDLALFLKEAVKFLERTIPENITISLKIDPGEYRVNADSTQIQQTLTNLAVNARDAMPDGGKLQLKLSRFTLQPAEQALFPGMRPGDWITLSVSDTGAGIPPEVLPYVFEPFFTTKEVGEGVGLGLAQVYGIVKQHEGYIDVESQGGNGTTFVIYLPPAAVPEEAPEEKMPEGIPLGRGQIVLLVEDEPEVLETGKAILKHLGYRVLAAANGQQAMEIHAEHKDQIALVLSDMVMPKIGGLELYQLLCKRDPDLKMVVVTGYPLGEKAGDPLPQGILGWVEKPFLVEKLAQVLHQALKES